MDARPSSRVAASAGNVRFFFAQCDGMYSVELLYQGGARLAASSIYWGRSRRFRTYSHMPVVTGRLSIPLLSREQFSSGFHPWYGVLGLLLFSAIEMQAYS